MQASPTSKAEKADVLMSASEGSRAVLAALLANLGISASKFIAFSV
jgi:hypothetical protein